MSSDQDHPRTRRVLMLTAGLGSLLLAPHALAAPAPEAASTVDEVVVTGSLIKGTATDAALPVNVISGVELQKRGSPTILDLVKSLPESSGVLGDTNQFDARAQGAAGTGSINLRGLGDQRTLVLLNGRRLSLNPVDNAGSGGVDTNLLPIAAIDRVEVLKDGAAATYGSDAIAGVVNFITRTDFSGLEVATDYRQINGSNGDYTASGLWGWRGDRVDVMATVGYEHRSQLEVLDRDFGNPTYLQNPQGGYTPVGNPGSYLPLNSAYRPIGAIQRDVNCSSLGGFAGFSGPVPVCYARSTQFDNLVEDEDRFQFFGTLNYRINDHIKFHLEGLYAQTDDPRLATSPTQPIVQNPSAEATLAPSLAGRFFVPASNPGFGSYVAANPGIFPAGTAGAQLIAWRPLLLGGNPLFGGTGASKGSAHYQAFRVSGGLTGDIGHGVNFDVNLTYMEDHSEGTSSDTLIDRVQLALDGLGGPNCDSNPNVPGIQGSPGVGGCMYFNPFSTAVAKNSATGQTNPQYNASVANSPDLIRWFYKPFTGFNATTLFVADATFDGKTNIHLGGGDLAWAAGGQYRRDTYSSKFTDLYNTAVTPCLATPDFGVTNCTAQTGPFGLLGTARDREAVSDVYAIFGELNLPLTKSIEAQLAARYEDYGGGVGSTFNPKFAVRWQALDWLAFRGSIGTTFRGPPAASLDANPVVSLQQINGVYRVVDTYGNPALKPETALTYSIGALVHDGGFRASVDFWAFDFNDPIVAEPIGGIVGALYPTATTNNCGNPAYAGIQSRFTFFDLSGGTPTNADCAAGNVSFLRTNIINGSKVKTSGLDLSALHKWNDVWGGALTLGADATYVIDYNVAALTVEGIVVAPAFDAVGKLNYQTTAYPLPQWKGSAYVNYTHGIHNIRWTVNYVDGYQDQRASVFAPSVNNSTNGVPVALPQGQHISSWLTHDVTYVALLQHDVTLSLAVENLLDTAPPFVRLNLSYDPFTASGLGRTVKIGVRKKF